MESLGSPLVLSSSFDQDHVFSDVESSDRPEPIAKVNIEMMLRSIMDYHLKSVTSRTTSGLESSEWNAISASEQETITRYLDRHLGHSSGTTVRPGYASDASQSTTHHSNSRLAHEWAEYENRMSKPLWEYLDRKQSTDRKLLKKLAKDIRHAEAKNRIPVVTPCTMSDLTQAVTDGYRFGTITMDPPWSYDNRASRGAAENHYSTMSIEELKAMPVGELASDQAHLHLWTTNAFLEVGMNLMKTWGFDFKSTFVWTKPQMGLGNYWRNSHEILLLGVRGNTTFSDRSLKSWGTFDRSRHSRKPDDIRRMIEQASPGPFLELFGRLPYPNWVVWGNEIERKSFETALRKLSV